MLSISVIIPTHNHGSCVGNAIASALSQSISPLEVIVVNDGSTDDTAEVLNGFGSRIRVIHQENKGVSAARNNGARIASGDLLAFLDADDAWLPGKLERQLGKFLVEPELGLVHCGVRVVSTSGAILEDVTAGGEGWVATEMLLMRQPVILGGGSGVAIRRRSFADVGGFDNRMSTSADWDLYYRIARKQKVGFVPEVLFEYRLREDSMHSRVREMEHDMLLAFSKAFGDPDPQLRTIRRQCHGNLHKILAGSYLASGNLPMFLCHALRSSFLYPLNTFWFLGYPVRYWKRRNFDKLSLRAVRLNPGGKSAQHK